MPIHDAKSIPAEVFSSTKDPEVATFLKTGPVLGAHKPTQQDKTSDTASNNYLFGVANGSPVEGSATNTRTSKMTITTKFSIVSVVALSIAAPAAAQQPDWSQKGDNYAPERTVVQQPTAAQTKQAEEGDHYAPAPTIVQQPTAPQTKRFEEGDYYAPKKGD